MRDIITNDTTDDGRRSGAHPPTDRREYRRVLVASFLGTAVEYYDFLLYGAAASLIFGRLFFSDLSPLIGTVAALGTMAAGYLSRPLGGAVFGHIGDRLGRKKTLTMTMMIMGTATVCIGFLPTTEQVGGLAPVLLILLRVIQGIGVGGEWGGATLMCYEHAAPGKRAFAASVVNAGMPLGTALAAVMLGAFSLLPEEHFLAWGWRVPFLLSALLVVVGLWMRRRISESPLFLEAEAQRPQDTGQDTRRAPLVQVFQRPGMLVAALFACLAPFVINAFVNSFGLLWAVEGGGLTRAQGLTAQAVGAVCNIFLALLAGSMADRFGHKPVMIFGITGSALFAYPFLLLVGSGSMVLAIVGNIISIMFLASVFAPVASFISELFPTSARYTGASLGYQLAATIAGGFSPMALSALLAAGGGTQLRYVVVFVVAAAAVGIVATALIKRPAASPVEAPLPSPVPSGTH